MLVLEGRTEDGILPVGADSENRRVGLDFIRIGDFAYGNEIIKDDNATLTSYGLLHREDYQPMQTPVQERFEMDTQQLT